MRARLIFVYGTLKQGQPNHGQMASVNGKSTFVGHGMTILKYPLVVASSANIPFLLRAPGTGQRIHGEIYEVDEPMLRFLDDFEANGVLYDREPIQVASMTSPESQAHDDEGAVEECHAYLLRNFKPEMLEKEMISNYTAKEAKTYKKHVDRDEFDNVKEQVKL